MTPNRASGEDMAALRRVLREALPTDMDFEAFCVDCFGQLHRDHFAGAMDRVQKESVLLQYVPITDIHLSLERWREQLESAPCHESERQQRAERQALSCRLQELYDRKEQLTLAGHDIADLQQEILRMRREQRHGPLLHQGEVLGDRFVLDRVIGSGGFACAWRAYDRQERMMVAVKVLHGQWSGDSSRIERFYRGARRMAQLHHPAIVRVIVTAQQDSGFHYFATEYLANGDLRRAYLSGYVSKEQAISALIQVSEALHHAHLQRIIHRDVKPSNILLDDKGNAKLGDFDLVYVADSTGGTRTTAIGSVFYAAPEAMENAKLVDSPRSDVYSLGMTLAFIINGVDLPQRTWTDRKSFLRDLRCSSRVKLVIERATALSPQARYDSAADFCAALREAALPTIPEPVPWAATWRHRLHLDSAGSVWRRGLIMGAVLVALGLGLFAARKSTRVSVGPPPATDVTQTPLPVTSARVSAAQPPMLPAFLPLPRVVTTAQPATVSVVDVLPKAESKPVLSRSKHRKPVRATDEDEDVGIQVMDIRK